MGYLSEWNPYERLVQGGFKDGEFANAQFMLIAAGPPRLANLGGQLQVANTLKTGGGDEMAYPIGICQMFNLSQNNQWFEVFEIGSRRGLFIQGRYLIQLTLGRVLYHGPSLLRMLMAYYEDTEGEVTVDPIFPNIGIKNVANKHDVRLPPGYENFYINLMSDLFTQPLGLLLSFKNSNLKTIGTGYIEHVIIPMYNLATDAQGVMVQENVTLQAERVMPVNAQEIELVTSEKAALIDAMRNA